MNLQFKKQAGFSLVTTIFILVVLVLLGAYMVTLMQLQNQSTSIAIQGARSGFAAYSGLEWGVKKAINDDDCVNVDGINLSLEGFSVTLACEGPYAVTEDASVYNVFKIISRAEYGTYGAVDYVSSITEATVRGQ